MLFADLMPAVLLEARGCPEITAERVARDTVRDLYLNNPIWIRTDPAATLEATGLLSLSLPDDAEVVEFRSLRLPDGTTITPRTVDDNASYNWDDISDPIITELNGVWIVKPAPVEDISDVRVVMQLAPTADADMVDDSVAKRHKSLYIHATLGRLLGMPDQKWSNPGVANYHGTRAMSLLFEAKRKADGWTTIRTPVVRYGGI